VHSMRGDFRRWGGRGGKDDRNDSRLDARGGRKGNPPGIPLPEFRGSDGFARQVGELAESEGHHPDLSVGWGYCTVRFQTHAIRGLHETTSSWRRRSAALSPLRPPNCVDSPVAATYTLTLDYFIGFGQ